MNDSWKRKYAALIATAISMSSAFLLLFMMICFGSIPIKTVEVNMLIGLTLPTLISLYLFPKLLQKVLLQEGSKGYEEENKNRKAFLYLVGFATIYGIVCRQQFESVFIMCMIIVHYIIVSLGEEFTYRKLILGLLKIRYKTWVAIIVSAIMFSFILHINGSMMVNLLIRFPIGMVLGYIAVKTDSIAYTIALHTIYNLIMLFF